MGRQMPWDAIPDSNVFPTGNFHVTGVKLEERFSNNGKLMYSADMQILEHPNTGMYTNMHHFENFVIGSDEDLTADVPGTWQQSFGAKRLKQMLKAAQVSEHADMDKICAGFNGVQFILSLRWFREPELNKDGTPNQYAGQERNDVTGFAKIGAKEPMIEPQKGAVGPGAKPAPVAPVAPPVSGLPVGPPAVAPPIAPPPVGVPVAGPPPTAPPTAVPPVGPPVVNVPQTPTPAVTPVAGGGQMLPCNVCGQQVPAEQFAQHIGQCMANQANKVG